MFWVVIYLFLSDYILVCWVVCVAEVYWVSIHGSMHYPQFSKLTGFLLQQGKGDGAGNMIIIFQLNQNNKIGRKSAFYPPPFHFFFPPPLPPPSPPTRMGTLYGVKVPPGCLLISPYQLFLTLIPTQGHLQPPSFSSYPHPFHSTLSLFILLSSILSYLHPCLSTPHTFLPFPILLSYPYPFHPTLILSILPLSFPSYPLLSILTRSFHPSPTLILSILPSSFHLTLILSFF